MKILLFLLILFCCLDCSTQDNPSFLYSTESEQAELLKNANQAFLLRENGPNEIERARKKYLDALSLLSGKNLIKASVRLARLDYFEALKTPETDINGLKSIFDRCLSDLETLKNTETVEYYYWKAGCLGGWLYADQGSSLESVKRLDAMYKSVKKCLQVDSKYEGGGCYREMGALLGGAPPVNPFGPTKDLNQALKYIEMAINSESSQNIDDGYTKATSSGDYFFHVYYFYALILDALNKKEKAIFILKDALERIKSSTDLTCSSANDLPCGREPETRGEAIKLSNLLNKFVNIK